MIVVDKVALRDEALVERPPGFGTRTEMMADLDDAIEEGRPASTLALFELAGLNEYVDLYGRLEGQALLVRLAGRLSDALGQRVSYYLPRADEFAALIHSSIEIAEPLLLAAVSELTIRFEQFEITPTFGAALLPDEASEPVEALMLADQRLFVRALARNARERRKHPREPRSN